MSKTQGCLDRVSFWRKALAAVLLIIFASAVSPCRADDGLQAVKLTESDFTKFWTASGVTQLYGYGYARDLMELYVLFDELEKVDSALANPMRSMPEVFFQSTKSQGWDYASAENEDRYRFCTNFVGAAILLRLLSFESAVQILFTNRQLNEHFVTVWREFSGSAVWMLMPEDNSRLDAQETFPVNLQVPNAAICYNLFCLLYRDDVMLVDAFVYFNPHRGGAYIDWKIEEEKVKERIG